MEADRPSSPVPGRFHSVLFTSPAIEAAQQRPDTSELFHDLFLDRVFDAAYGALAPRKRSPFDYGRQDADADWRDEVWAKMREFFAMPAADAELARQRQAVARDLRREEVARPLRDFQTEMAAMRANLRRVKRASGPIEGQGWLLGAARIYCDALEKLQAGLDAAAPQSEILRMLCADLATDRAGPAHQALRQRVAELQRDLALVRYAVRIEGDQVTVLHDPAAEDYSATVARTFSRFRQGEVRDYRVQFPSKTSMNHIEEQIVDRVALLYPELFARLDQFGRQDAEFADARWLRLDRELPFYLSWWDSLRRLASAGVQCCLPDLVAEGGSIDVADAVDLALAEQSARASQTVVANDFALRGAGRMIVVTGPNHGGKTTLARVFGQIHYVGSLGLPVAAARAQLLLPDRILTHFERAEDITTQRGKLQDDLVRMHRILDAASARSVVVMNEVFSSTSLDDALWLGRRMMEKLRAVGCACLFVTFLDELATFDANTVSMVALVDPADPTIRTYKVARKAADGKAYAQALAEKYRVTRSWLARRIDA